MEITWYGLSCFRLTERGMATVVTDPYDHNVVGFSPLKLRGDIVSISHDAPGHSFEVAVKSKKRILNGPGEYEIGSVFITAVQTNGKKRASDDRGNILYVFDYDGVTVAHLGDLSKVPSQSQVERLGNVNVALVPVGGGRSLNAAKAAEVVSLIEPGIVIPMHYQMPACKLNLNSLDKFTKEMGLGEVEPLDSIKVSRSTVPTETRVVVLNHKAS